MRRREGVTDVLHRYRGVAVLTAVPILLIGLVYLVMPSSEHIRRLPNPDESDTFSDRAESMTNKIPEGQGHDAYAVIFDAGSTGSRVHIYSFTKSKGQMDLDEDTFEQLKPGLSAYADDPEKAAQSLQPLVKIALDTVPKHLQSKTRIKLGATAGLRLLPGDQADKILEAVKAYFAQQPFILDPKDGVTILDGKDEGAFAWLTLNYLLGYLGKAEEETMAAIDLGGGSVQQAFALTPTEASQAPDGYITKLSGGGKEYHVYVHSYLGFGLMAGRAAVLAWEETKQANPCVPSDHTGIYQYGGLSYNLVASPSGASFESCSKLVTLVLKQDADCGAPVAQCAFNGAWGGGNRHPTAFYVSSYFWDRATDAGIIREQDAIMWDLKPADLVTAATLACSTPIVGLAALFPKVGSDQAPYLCLDLTFQHTLLTAGFKIPESTKVSLVKRVKYHSQEVEAAWPLGAGINVLSQDDAA